VHQGHWKTGEKRGARELPKNTTIQLDVFVIFAEIDVFDHHSDAGSPVMFPYGNIHLHLI
jgi:hypothetical protein